MKVLVTGATGFIGQWCVKEFRNRDFDVTALGFRPETSQRAQEEGVRSVNIDLKDQKEWSRFLSREKADALIHLAWDIAPWDDPTHTKWLHISNNVVEAFIDSGGSYLFTAGTSMEYAWDGRDCREDGDQFSPATVYGRAKHDLWKRSRALADSKNVAYSHGRIFFVCGPGQKGAKFLPAIINSLIAGENFNCSGSYLYRDYLDARTYAQLIADLLTQRRVGDFNLSSGEAVSIEKIALEVAAQLKEEKLVKLAESPTSMPQDRYVIGNVEKLKKAVGYTPEFDLGKSIEDTIRHIQSL